MYSIELLLAQIEELDNEKCSLQKAIKRYKKNEKIVNILKYKLL